MVCIIKCLSLSFEGILVLIAKYVKDYGAEVRFKFIEEAFKQR
jgi:hypothetical protein